MTLDWLHAPFVFIRLIRSLKCIWQVTCRKHCTTLQGAQQSSEVKCTSLTVSNHLTLGPVLPLSGLNLFNTIPLPQKPRWSQLAGSVLTADLQRKELRVTLYIWILWKQCLTQWGVPAEKRRATQAWPQRLIQDGGRKTALLPTLCPRCSRYQFQS